MALCALALPGAAAPSQPKMLWKPLRPAPTALIQAYRADKDVSSPPPTLQDVRVARFMRVMEPGQPVPLFLVDPNTDNLTGSAGSLLVGYIPRGRSYRDVLGVYSDWASVANAPSVSLARREAARGKIALLPQPHALPLVFFPSHPHDSTRPWRFNGKEYNPK